MVLSVRITGFAISPTDDNAIPNIIEKITICSISLFAIASKRLLGTICTTKFSREKEPVLFTRSSAGATLSMVTLVFFPGSSQFTSTMPSNSDISDAERNHAIAFTPTRPTIFISPILAMPTTRVQNTSGAMIICTMRINKVPSSLMFLAKAVALSAYW